MGPHNSLGVILCLAAVSTVYSQSSRDRLFAKPRDFKLQRATTRTRFTEEEKKLILQIHNSYRSLVEPPATGMRELIWDDDLEQYAWNHTQACTGKHSAGTMVKKFDPDLPATWQTWTAMGENLYYSYAPWYSIEGALWMFWTEGKYYNITDHTCASGKECGHFRIMALARSARVGCAMNVCNKFTVSKYPTPAVFLSCSYNGQYLIYYKPYTVGARGSDCTYEKQSYDYQYYRNGLCSRPSLNWVPEDVLGCKVASMTLTTSSSKCRLVYENVGLAPYVQCDLRGQYDHPTQSVNIVISSRCE